MKYVILIHSNPVPWDHPTQLFTDEGRALPAEQHAAMDRRRSTRSWRRSLPLASW